MKNYILEKKKLFSPTLCKKIIEYFNNDLHQAGTVGDGGKDYYSKKIRNCQTKSLIDNSNSFGKKLVLNTVHEKIIKVCNLYSEKFPHCNIEKISQIDLLKYEANDYKVGYHWHVDFGGTCNERHLSISINLNNDFQGGEFLFDLPEGVHECVQNTGDAIVFPSNFMFPHQVNPINQGVRYAIIAWAL